jgi:hypothetical protein
VVARRIFGLLTAVGTKARVLSSLSQIWLQAEFPYERPPIPVRNHKRGFLLRRHLAAPRKPRLPRSASLGTSDGQWLQTWNAHDQDGRGHTHLPVVHVTRRCRGPLRERSRVDATGRTAPQRHSADGLARDHRCCVLRASGRRHHARSISISRSTCTASAGSCSSFAKCSASAVSKRRRDDERLR